MIHQALINELSEYSVYPGHLPETATYPCVAYRRSSGEHYHNLAGASGVDNPYVTLEIFSDSFRECLDTAEGIRQLLQGKSFTDGTTEVWVGLLENEIDNFYKPEDGSDTGVYSVTLEYQFLLPEST